MKKLLIILLLMPVFVFAQKTEPTYDAKSRLEIPDSLRPPQRLVWNGEKGVFLTQKQEELTLEKLQWRDVYKNDAITFYMVSLQLNNRIVDLEDQLKEYKIDLTKCEAEALDKNQKMLDYQKAWQNEKDVNAALRDDKMILKRKLTKSIVLNVGLGAGLVGTGIYFLTR